MGEKRSSLASAERLHVVAFSDAAHCVSAVRDLRAHGMEVADVHTPYAVHGLPEAMGLPESRLGAATLLGGVCGFALVTALAVWTHTTDWPLNVGGKDNLALAGIIPVMFEATVLLGGIATVLALLFRCRLLPRLPLGTPASQPMARVTDDRFAVVVREHDGSFERPVFRSIAARWGACEVIEGWKVRG